MDTDRLTARARRTLDRPGVRVLRTRCARQLRWIARRFSPEGALGLSLTVGLVVLAGCGWAFAQVLDAVAERDDLTALDSPATRWLVAHRVGWLTDVMHVVTNFGSARLIIPLVLVVSVLVAIRTRRWRHTLTLPISAGGAALIVTGVKLLIARPRPEIGEIVATANGFSFPSGHSAQATATYGALAWLATLWLRRRTTQGAAWLGAAAAVLLIGFSRLYLGVHWLSDVAGGIALGAAWLALTITATTTFGRLRDERRAGTRARAPR